MASESDDDLRRPEQPDHTYAGTEPDHEAVPHHGRRSQLTVALVAGAVLLAGGGAYWAASAADSTHDAGAHSAPPPLVLNGGMPVGNASLGGGSPSQHIKFTGTLPVGPASAPVYQPDGQVTRDQVAKLAAALHVTGSVTSAPGVWKAAPSGGHRGPTLQVGKDAPDSWAFARAGAGAGCGTSTATAFRAEVCYGMTGQAGGASTGGAVSEATAKRLAAPVLNVLGLGGAPVDASQTVGNIRTVTVDPVVGGLPTHGWQTTLQVGPDGTLTSGAGRMVPLVRGAVYPVVSAQRALDELQQPDNANAPAPTLCGMMHPGMKSNAETDAGTSGAVAPSTAPVRGNAPCVASTPPLQVRGAKFGLSAQFVSGRPELVPSWLFEATQPDLTQSGTGQRALTLAQPAVDPKFVTAPSTPPAVTSPGTPPGTVVPVPSPSGGAKASTERAESFTADGRTLTLRFWGGLCSNYSATVISQSGDSVRVRITGVVKDPHQKCVMLAKSITVRTTLDQPLGSRTVYDAADGHALPARQP